MICQKRIVVANLVGLVLACIMAQPILAINSEPEAAHSNSFAPAADFAANSAPDPFDIINGTGGAVPWPMFRQQPSHIGFNGVETTIGKANVQRLGLAWVGIMGDIADFTSPAVVNGFVYIGSFDGRLYAFKANGCGSQVCQPVWSGATGNDIISSPAVTNGTVFVGSEDHNLYAFAAAGCGKSDCAPLWLGVTAGAVDSGPVVTPTVVYVGSEDHNLYAFATGGCGQANCAPLWRVPTGGGVNSSPALVNNVLYFGSQDGKLYAVSAQGCGQQVCSPLWTAQVGSMIFGSSPAVSNGVVYIASFNEIGSTDSRLYAFDAKGCGQMTCQPLWTAPAGDFVQSSPAVAKGKVYVGSGDDLMYAYNAAGCGQSTCNFLWRGEAVGAQAALISSPAVANGLVYIGENNGMVEVFDADGCGQAICLPVTQLLIDNEPIVSSSPAVVNGTVYVGSADQLQAPIGRLYVFKLVR
jgi:outer membrane protein assembly factor BamB